VIALYVSGEPAPKGSPRVVTRGKGGRVLSSPLVLSDSAKTERWQAAVRAEATRHLRLIPPLTVPVSVFISFCLRRPKSVRRAFPSVKPDIDKLIRSTLDGLNGVAFTDDALVVEVRATKAYATTFVGARIQIDEVTP
jgi:Holliday junction resolvase RusA-like endonuclease